MVIKNYKDIFFHGYIISFSSILAIAISFDYYIHNYDDAKLEALTLVILLFLYYFWKKANHKNIYAIALSWLSALFAILIVIDYDFHIETPFFLLFIPFAFLYLLDKKTLFVHLGIYYVLTIVLMIWGYFYSENRIYFDNPIHMTVWCSLFLFVLSIGIFNYLMLSRSFKYLEDANVQKDVLLQEVHHRVKNNLNMMSSMIGLHDTKNNPEMQTFINDYRQRINAIALIHELLYKKDDFSNINFQTYISKLGHYLIASCAHPSTHIHIEAERISFSLEKLTSLGLILQELISNSLKHANSGNNELYLTLKKTNNEYILHYSDNGSRKQTLQNSDKSLGINIVELKVKELHGTIELEKIEKKLFSFVLEDGKEVLEKYYTHKYTIRFPYES